jgi:hypothetical protein
MGQALRDGLATLARSIHTSTSKGRPHVSRGVLNEPDPFVSIETFSATT